MPLSFIAICLVIIYIFVYKKIGLVKINPTLLATILLMMLIGYFIEPINFLDKFTINIIFFSCLIFVSFELLVRISFKKTIITLTAVVLSAGVYYLISYLNNDYLTFFNYYPIFIAVTVISMAFCNNTNMSVPFALLSYLLIEFLNYFIFSNTIGILNLCSYEFLNYVIFTLIINLSVCYLVKAFGTNTKKIKGVDMTYEKQNKQA